MEILIEDAASKFVPIADVTSLRIGDDDVDDLPPLPRSFETTFTLNMGPGEARRAYEWMTFLYWEMQFKRELLNSTRLPS